jgi:hypothetical protein
MLSLFVVCLVAGPAVANRPQCIMERRKMQNSFVPVRSLSSLAAYVTKDQGQAALNFGRRRSGQLFPAGG